MLTEEEKKELEHLEGREPRSDYDVWFGVNEFDLRIEFCNIKEIPVHSAIKGTELEKEYNEYCRKEFENYNIQIEIDF